MPNTKAQDRALETLRKAAIDRNSGTVLKSEIKLWKVTTFDNGDLFVTVTAGLIGDEGTLNEVLSRHHGNFLITKRGAINAMWRYAKHGRKGLMRKYPLIYGFSLSGA